MRESTISSPQGGNSYETRPKCFSGRGPPCPPANRVGCAPEDLGVIQQSNILGLDAMEGWQSNWDRVGLDLGE